MGSKAPVPRFARCTEDKREFDEFGKKLQKSIRESKTMFLKAPFKAPSTHIQNKTEYKEHLEQKLQTLDKFNMRLDEKFYGPRNPPDSNT